jgi:hypothetical protein
MPLLCPASTETLSSEVASIFLGPTNMFEVETGGDSWRLDASPSPIPEPRLAVTSVGGNQVIDAAEYVKIDAIAPDEIRLILDFGHWHPDLEWISADNHLAVGKYGLPGISANNDVGEFGTNGSFLGIKNLVCLFTDWMKAKAGFNACCGSVSCIVQENIYPHIRIRHWAKSQSDNLYRENLYPRTLIGFHNLQLTAENPPTSPSECGGTKNEKDCYYGQRYIYVFVSIFMFGLSILCIANGLNRGSYLGGGIVLLGLPLVAVGIYCFFNGFLNLPFP